MINATLLNQDGTGDLACLRRGNFSSITASQAGRVTRTNTALLRWYADDAGVVLTGTGSVPDIRNGIFRTLLTKDNTGGHIRVHSLMGQVKAYDAFWNTEVVSAVHGRIELVRSAATMTLGGNGITAAVLGIPSVSGAVTVNTNHVLAGVAAISDFRATLTQTGRVAAFLCAQYDTTNWSDSTARTTWGYGLLILNSSVATGVEIGNCTTGIILGTATTGITFNGTTTTAISLASAATTAINIAGACTTAINIARTTAKTAIRVGEWAASQAAGSAVVFATNMAGVDTSQLNIIAAFGESTSDLTSAYSTSVIRGRHLVSAAADTVIAHEVYGVMGQVVCKNASFNHYASGVMGTFEASNTLTHVMSGYVAAAVTGRIGGAVLTSESGAIVAGVAAINNSTAHTATGIIAGFATHKTAAGIAWPIGLYMGDGSVTQAVLIGLSSSSPIITTSTGTTNMVEVNAKLNAASGILRGILAYAEFSGTQVSTTVNCYAIRGYSKISGTLTSGNGYAAGVQGKIEISGTLGSGSRVCGVLAQINSSAGTLSSGGEIMGLWVDSQLTTKGSATVNMVAIQNTVAGVVIDNFCWIFGRGTSAFKFDTNDGTAKDYLTYASTAPAAATGSIAINVNGATRYILITDDPTA